MMDLKHGGWDEHILHLLQELGTEAGDGDLLRGHERGQGRVQSAYVSQAGKRHGPGGRSDGC